MNTTPRTLLAGGVPVSAASRSTPARAVTPVSEAAFNQSRRAISKDPVETFMAKR
jgi:hypothetical protein